MISMLFIILLLPFLLWVGFKVTGAILTAIFWLVFIVPFTFLICILAIACCATLILIPVGIALFKFGFKLLIPGI